MQNASNIKLLAFSACFLSFSYYLHVTFSLFNKENGGENKENHSKENKELSASQLMLVCVFSVTLVYYLVDSLLPMVSEELERRYNNYSVTISNNYYNSIPTIFNNNNDGNEDVEKQQEEIVNTLNGNNNNNNNNNNVNESRIATISSPTSNDIINIPILSFNIIRFGLPIMGYIYTSYTGAFAAKKQYNSDLFWGLHVLLFLVSLLQIRKTSDSNPLNRDQTEEWKGWMQVIFLAYHYYAASGLVYNLVRVLIAAYVWMTGFGHFIYFYTTDNFDVVRVVRTLFRLNWLVIFTCFATTNQYMLYYICSMHTFWFLFTFVVMRIKHESNKVYGVIPLKLFISFLLIVVLFEFDGVFVFLSKPFSFILERNNDDLHEWNFRMGLDHYAAWLGMVCGYLLPYWKKLLQYLEAMNSFYSQWMYKTLISTIWLLLCHYFYVNVFVLEKYEYNRLHPYYSWIPILSFLWLRNISVTLRSYYLSIFGWWGRVTLESYISQIHLLLTNNAAAILYIFPDTSQEYRILNMIVVSLIFGFASKMLFDSTVYFCSILTPEPASKMTRRFSILICISSAIYLSCTFWKIVMY